MESEERLRDASYRASQFDPEAAGDPPARARAVVVGGGIIGASVALHLARLGWTDTVVLERSRVASGTTWHAAGLMTRARGTHMQTEMASYSRDFYRDLATLSGIDIGYYANGSLSLARTPERLTELRYALTLAHHHGLPARELSPDEIAGVSPLLRVEDLEGGVLFEEDATVNPGWAAFATAKAAHDLGVRLVEGVRVTGLALSRGPAGVARVTGVHTDRGDVECDVVVLAAGLWTRDLALLAGARVPLHPAEHYWARTEPVDGADRDLPIVRDLDGSIYVRHYRGGLIVGAFEPDGRPRTAASIPEDFSFGEFAPDLEHFGRPLARARERVPALERARFAHYLCAPESFTPDGNFVLGETGEVAGLFVAAGMNSQGIILGPGVGRALAAWIDEGAPTVDAADVDVRRFSPAQTSAGYLFERTRESLGRLYAMHWPFLQPGTARGLRRVPLYGRLAAAGAVFGEASGWERADWYARPDERPGERPEYEYSYGRQNWFAAVAEEHRAARQGVALFDLSSFTKIRVDGPDALRTVQRVFTADLDRPPGRVTYTSMLNARGGVELDGTVSRLDEQAFLLVTSSTAQARAFHWLRRLADPSAVVSDVTSGLGVLSVTGPRSRELLAGLTDADLSDQAFPFARA
ncbi:MAG TPA: FAD-dependent oxidoreductase, partial [Thermoleophilia bacterium]|nr:FAD-dependent oxidoreductase [Thermoleophilia bacterium]